VLFALDFNENLIDEKGDRLFSATDLFFKILSVVLRGK